MICTSIISTLLLLSLLLLYIIISLCVYDLMICTNTISTLLVSVVFITITIRIIIICIWFIHLYKYQKYHYYCCFHSYHQNYHDLLICHIHPSLEPAWPLSTASPPPDAERFAVVSWSTAARRLRGTCLLNHLCFRACQCDRELGTSWD